MDDKPTRRKEDRPAEIVSAAIEIFSEVGFAQAKVADIARRAGAAKGTVYLYFRTKEELFEAVVQQYIKPVFNEMSQRIKGFSGPASDMLQMLIREIYRHLPNSPERRGIMRILIAEGPRFPQLTEYYHREVIAGASELIRHIVQRGVDAGEFRSVSAANFPITIVGPIMMAAVWKMSFDQVAPLDLDALCNAHIDLVLNGLKLQN